MRSIEVPRSRSIKESFSISGDSGRYGNQAYIDLLKASWIMNTFIMKGDSPVVMTSDENRKLLLNLANVRTALVHPEHSTDDRQGLRSELGKFTPIDALSDSENFDEQEYDLFETMQPEEEDGESADLFGPDPGRYITEELHDAGDEDEIVVFRTFVNAEIGPRKHRVKSAGAPYLLCLSSKGGGSEPRVTLCNQSCSMELARDFTVDDLQKPKVPTSHVLNVANMNTEASYPLDFGTMKTAIAFTNTVDMHNFMNIPRRYFDAVKRREARILPRSTETLLFKRSVEVYEKLTPDTLMPMSSEARRESCDLRIFETTSREGWKTTRRLVISSSFAEEDPWCQDYFLPLSRVQIRRHEEVLRKATVKWSNCRHEIIGTDGYWNSTYNYIYDDQNPNVAISVAFRNSADATEFESQILTLSLRPIYPAVSPLISTLPVGALEKVIYDISDTGPEAMNYKAILLTHTSRDWRYGELYYTFRDADFVYDHASLKIRFPSVTYITYISNYCDNNTVRPLREIPQFDHCEKRRGTFSVDFEDVTSIMAFMSALCPGWNLLFSRRTLSLSTRPPAKFGRSAISKKGPTEIQLWQKHNTSDFRLLSRWADTVDDKWLSLSVDKAQARFPPGSNKAVLGRHEFRRGRKVDMKDLTATDAKDGKNADGKGPVTVVFERVQDREDFESTLTGAALSPNGKPTSPPTGSALEQLLMMN